MMTILRFFRSGIQIEILSETLGFQYWGECSAPFSRAQSCEDPKETEMVVSSYGLKRDSS